MYTCGHAGLQRVERDVKHYLLHSSSELHPGLALSSSRSAAYHQVEPRRVHPFLFLDPQQLFRVVTTDKEVYVTEQDLQCVEWISPYGIFCHIMQFQVQPVWSVFYANSSDTVWRGTTDILMQYFCSQSPVYISATK